MTSRVQMWRNPTLTTTYVLVGLALGGCGATNAAQVEKLQQRLVEMSQAQAKRDKQIDTLSNRIFLLEDKVDTSRVAIQRRQRRPMRLPVVRIRPEDTADPPPRVVARPHRSAPGTVRISGRSDGGGRSLVGAEDVEYSGAAARSSGPRPVLKLSGGPARAAASPRPRRPISGPDPAKVKEKLPVVPVAKGSVARKLARAKPGSSTAMRAYTKALTTYRKGRYSAAASAFRAFVGRYTKHAYADNALYWLGECFYDLKNYRLAVKMFRRVVEQYPNGNKAPAALLKLGFAYLKLKEKKNASTVLAQVVEIFPSTGVARLATRELARLKVQ
ncbi:MAG: tol-pal system protein YbgF [Proteobacteria bacterium]|nr:MAG: tol-pal system protein YbgF [Pseudomonadota bacterium]PIE19692.1 MAG: tol-pal system protein YbgF [Pseudomonadota bacterium]